MPTTPDQLPTDLNDLCEAHYQLHTHWPLTADQQALADRLDAAILAHPDNN
jgi:hypothetical protein